MLHDFAPPEGGCGRLAPWWFADALVVVGGAGDCAITTLVDDADGIRTHDAPDDAAEETGVENVGVSALVQHPPLHGTEAPTREEVRALSDSPVPAQWLLSLARVAGQMGPASVFFLCEGCDGTEGRPTAAAAASAVAIVTGIPASNVLCVASTMEAADAAPSRAAGPWRSAVVGWYNAWAGDRARKMRPAFAPMRETIQFWAMLANQGDAAAATGASGDDAASRGGQPLRHRHVIDGVHAGETGGGGVGDGGAHAHGEEEISRALQHLASSHGGGERPPPGSPAEDERKDGQASSVGGAASKLHASAALVSLGSFLRTSIEGLPRVGVIGAPEIASRQMRQDPNLTRRGLLATVYRYSAMEFAAGFVLSWMVPGPLAALAAHFTNRFRICFAVACLAGVSPLDPRTVATVLATCAGADGPAVRRSTLAAAERRAEISSREAAAREAAAAEKSEKTAATSGDGDCPLSPLGGLLTSSGPGGRRLGGRSATRIGAKMDAAIAKVVTEGKELRAKAAAAMHKLLTSGIDAVWEADLKAVTKARRARAALAASSSEDFAPAAIDDAAERVYSQVMARETALSLATVVCGPLWLAATQADMVSVMAGALSVYTANASISMYLPALTALEDAEAVASAASLTAADGVVTAQLDVDLEEGEGFDGLDRADAGGSSAGDLGSMLNAPGEGLRVRVKLVVVPRPGIVNRLARQTRAGFDAVSTSVSAMTSGFTTATSNVGRATAAWFNAVGQPFGGGPRDGQGHDGRQRPMKAPNVKELPPEKIAAAIGDPTIQTVIGQPAMVMKMMSDPIIMGALRDPAITKAYMEFTREPSEYAKYKDDPKIAEVAQRVLELVVASNNPVAMEIIHRHELLGPRRRHYTDMVFNISEKYGFRGITGGSTDTAVAASHAPAHAAVDTAAAAERKARTEAIAAKYGKGKGTAVGADGDGTSTATEVIGKDAGGGGRMLGWVSGFGSGLKAGFVGWGGGGGESTGPERVAGGGTGGDEDDALVGHPLDENPEEDCHPKPDVIGGAAPRSSGGGGWLGGVSSGVTSSLSSIGSMGGGWGFGGGRGFGSGGEAKEGRAADRIAAKYGGAAKTVESTAVDNGATRESTAVVAAERHPRSDAIAAKYAKKKGAAADSA